MLVDHAVITVKAGNGGRACYKTRFRRPIGGDGGKGGDVIIEGSVHVYDLGQFRGMTLFEAQNGDNGQQDGKQGRTGADITVKVPFGTTISNEGNILQVISQDVPYYVIAHGKKGAYGNLSQKRLHMENKIYSDKELAGEEVLLELDFKLQADVLFIGYPNAGKSSMLNRLSRANAKVAPYAFTTLEPQLGRMNGIVLMDLPGLIDGTHEGKGLGTAFVKHTHSSRLMAHFVALDSATPYAMYKKLKKELERIDPELAAKKEIVVLSKSDEVTPAVAKNIQKKFTTAGIESVICSVIDDESVVRVQALIEKSLPEAPAPEIY